MASLCRVLPGNAPHRLENRSMSLTLVYFFRDTLRALFRGPPGYWLWVGFLLALIGLGGWSYQRQLVVEIFEVIE